MVDQETRPLVVCEHTGAPVDVVHQNAKGHTKSLESGDLWSLHPETGRLLPYPGGAGATVEDHGSWYRAVLAGAGPQGGGDLPGDQRARGEVRQNAAMDNGGDKDLRSADARSNTIGVPGAAVEGGDRLGTVLTDLAALIRTRHEEMPAGSYTTHLFESGSQKIRKKVGEEAAEILLANGEELISETADFLYHLLVLLEAEGITLDQIAAELKQR